MTGISIIIPCFNQTQYLMEAIESVYKQEIDDFEIIIVNDGSDASEEKFFENIASYKNVYVFHQEHKGAAAARNLGIHESKKECIAFLDADDVWKPKKLYFQLAMMKELNVGMVFSEIEQFLSPELMSEKLKTFEIKNKILPGICASTMLVKRNIFSQIGAFDEQLKLGEFIAWYLRAKASSVTEHIIKKVFVYRRIHQRNTSHQNKAHRADYLKVLLNRNIKND